MSPITVIKSHLKSKVTKSQKSPKVKSHTKSQKSPKVKSHMKCQKSQKIKSHQTSKVTKHQKSTKPTYIPTKGNAVTVTDR